MTDSECKEVWSILNAISCFVSGINNRMEYLLYISRLYLYFNCVNNERS